MAHISVTIPVFNRAHLVGRTIESVLAQTFKDFDVLIVDDCSTDGTVGVVRKYFGSDPRIKLIVNDRNLGLTRNWNKCIGLAVGPLVQILQSDDLINADYLEEVSRVFAKYPNLGFVAASCRYIDVYGELIYSGSSKKAAYYSAGDDAVIALLLGGHPHVSSIVVRTQCFQEIGLFNEAIWSAPDVEMDTRLAAHFDFYHFGKVCTSFRRHGGNSGNTEFLQEGYLDTYRRNLELTLSYLSQEGKERLGIADVKSYMDRNSARTALAGAKVMIPYRRPDLARSYFHEALRLNPLLWKDRQLWKVLLLLVWPRVTGKIMRYRMRMTESDIAYNS